MNNELELAENKRRHEEGRKAESGVGTAGQAERTACPEAGRCAVVCCGWVPVPRLGDKRVVVKGSAGLATGFELDLEGHRAVIEGCSAGR